jgi:uncharacterized protein
LHKYLNYLGISFDSGWERFYHPAPMSQRGSDLFDSADGAKAIHASSKGAGTGGQIDGLQFARSGGVRAGALAAEVLPRLTESGALPTNIVFRIEGGRDPSGFSVLRITVTGTLTLICQRCLGEFEWSLATDTTLRLAKSQTEIELAEDEVDRVLASRSMDVVQLVEDEILLAMPMVPRHERCGGDALKQGKSGAVSPFEALAALKRGSRVGNGNEH